MTPFEQIQQINERLDSASIQLIANTNDPGNGVRVDTGAVRADQELRETLYRELAKDFIAVYFDPTQVQAGEPILAALYRRAGGVAPFLKHKAGPIMEALLEHEIGFTEEGDLLLMRDESIAWACKALGLNPKGSPDWNARKLLTGQTVIRKELVKSNG